MDVRDPAVPALPYAKAAFASLAYTPRAPRRVLLLGLGGGAMIGFLRKHVPEATIVAVDIDPVVVEIAQAWFGVVPDDHLELVTADAVAYVRDTRESFDTIYLDTFLEPSGSETDSSGVPKSLRTVEFLRTVRERLAPQGVAAFNLHHKSDLQGHLDAIQAAFADMHLIRVPGSSNRIVVASAQGKLPAPAEIEQRAAKLDGRLGAGFALAPLVRDILVPGPAAPPPTSPQGR
jgi:spermidine synthase